ncbi:MAG: toll/interleukin-1 receptor domain-containing protein, partial [Deltaproteobacteria bacterium]|nr:toll/interleukin-1 receptor domain-containing protein [Deltaproteobacteria bacterium]
MTHPTTELRDKMAAHLKILERNGVITSWHDRKIPAGEEWKSAIDANFQCAEVILLLVSADFIASDYCYEIEMKGALERHEKGEARVVPIIVRPCRWQTAPFGRLQALPKDGKPMTSWG